MTTNETTNVDTTIEEVAEILETSAANADNENVEVSTVDRFQQRLERFGTIAPEAKKLSRALRFGTSTEIPVDDETRKRRLERFGIVHDSSENVQEKKRQRAERFNINSPTITMDDETKKKRMDRFGVVTPTPISAKNEANNKSSSTSPVLTDAIKKRVERFGDIAPVAKSNTTNEQKAKRAERFKPITAV